MKRDESDEKGFVQIDFYGIKVTARPNSDSEADPTTWAEVAQRVNQELKSIALGIFRLLGSTVKAATSILRGVGDLPHTINRRISESHAAADRLESLRGKANTLDSSASNDSMNALLSKKLTEGYTVRAISDGDRTVLLFLPPTSEDDVEALAATAIAQAGGIASVEPSRSGVEKANPFKRLFKRLRSSFRT